MWRRVSVNSALAYPDSVQAAPLAIMDTSLQGTLETVSPSAMRPAGGESASSFCIIIITPAYDSDRMLLSAVVLITV